jgi:periplasmic copper chaperone A
MDQRASRAALTREPSRPGRRWRLAIAIAAVVLAPFGTACGAGQASQTAEQVASGPVARVGEITVADVEFLFDGPIAGDEVYRVGESASIAATIVNEGATADRLVRVSSPIASAALIAAEELVIPGGGTLTTGQTGPLAAAEVTDEDDIGAIVLAGLLEPIRSGRSYPVVFEFNRAGEVVVDVPVATPDVPRRPAEESG